MQDQDDPIEQSSSAPRWSAADRIVSTCGYLLIISAVLGFLAAGGLQIFQATVYRGSLGLYESWLDVVQREAPTISLLVMAIVAAMLGKQLLTTARLSQTRTIPHEDLPLVRQAVIDGKPEPIDQYVRLRSLSGFSGHFTKLGVTGLPLTTVSLTLIFSFISLTQLPLAEDFLDLAKLTLGAFIGSFVQRQVEQRRQEAARPTTEPSRSPDIVA